MHLLPEGRQSSPLNLSYTYNIVHISQGQPQWLAFTVSHPAQTIYQAWGDFDTTAAR
ncbi:unannotated protein [freshwater metagenome]|uniref:Unannotated protein n=1 Tax=freshwater metagenome TaxID=449393 RepID=A0A6J7E3E9_9ZZZZ